MRTYLYGYGFVDTNIDKSERPGYLTHQDVSWMSLVFLGIAVAQAREATVGADIVFEAIKKTSACLPHPAWDEMLRDRFDQMLSREPIPTPSPDEIARFRLVTMAKAIS